MGPLAVVGQQHNILISDKFLIYATLDFSNQAVGDTDDLYTASIDNTLNKYTASKKTVI